MSTENNSRYPKGSSDRTPERTLNRTPDRKPVRNSERTPERGAERNPNRVPNRTPDRDPERVPNRTPDRNPRNNRKKKKKRRQSLVLFIIEIVVLAVLVGGVFVYAKLSAGLRDNLGTEIDKKNEKKTPAGTSDPNLDTDDVFIDAEVVQNRTLDDYTNIALVGIDTREHTIDYGNSDTMLVASINNNTGKIKMISLFRDTYLCINQETWDFDKCNAAYNLGSAKQFMSMLNANLDLNITDYVVVDFNAVARLVDDLGGIDVLMTHEEVAHMNNYCVETSEVTGLSYTPIEPIEGTHNYHLNGVQAVSYARVRYTNGHDLKRTQRQRLVIQKIVDKAKQQGLTAVEAIIEDVFPLCKTNLSTAQIIKYASRMFDYEIESTSGFPFKHLEMDVWDAQHNQPLDAVVPVTLEKNVQDLHSFFFGVSDYTPSHLVREFSAEITNVTGVGEDRIQEAEQNSVIPNIGGEADTVR